MPDRAAAGRNRSANQRYGSFTVFHTHRHTHVTCIVVRRRPGSATVRMPRPCAWPADSALRAVESLDAARTLGDGDSPLVFPSVGGKPLSYEPLYVGERHGSDPSAGREVDRRLRLGDVRRRRGAVRGALPVG